jgi:hypothetical protein
MKTCLEYSEMEKRINFASLNLKVVKAASRTTLSILLNFFLVEIMSCIIIKMFDVKICSYLNS